MKIDKGFIIKLHKKTLKISNTRAVSVYIYIHTCNICYQSLKTDNSKYYAKKLYSIPLCTVPKKPQNQTAKPLIQHKQSGREARAN